MLIAPTWRSHLLLPQQFGHRRALAMDLQTSLFMVGWRRLLDHPGLLEAAEKHDLRLAFLAHPHLQDHVRAEHVPAHVEVYSMLKDDIQGLLAQTRLFITDYSSAAFDAAYLQIPVVYYQFDAEDFFCGRHTCGPATTPTPTTVSDPSSTNRLKPLRLSVNCWCRVRRC